MWYLWSILKGGSGWLRILGHAIGLLVGGWQRDPPGDPRGRKRILAKGLGEPLGRLYFLALSGRSVLLPVRASGFSIACGIDPASKMTPRKGTEPRAGDSPQTMRGAVEIEMSDTESRLQELIPQAIQNIKRGELEREFYAVKAYLASELNAESVPYEAVMDVLSGYARVEIIDTSSGTYLVCYGLDGEVVRDDRPWQMKC